jgi:hypothetical protein
MKEYNDTMRKLIEQKGYAYTLGFLEAVLEGQLNENELSKVRNAFVSFRRSALHRAYLQPVGS